MREFLKLGIVLMLICVAAAGALATTYRITSPMIASQKSREQQQSLKEVLPEADKFTDKTAALSGQLSRYASEIDGVFLATKGPEKVGFILTVAVPGYSGPVKAMVGVKDEKIVNVKILSQTETPGLGTKITEASFLNQFRGKPIDREFKVKKDGGEIEAITGATISSRSVARDVSIVVNFLGQREVRKAVGM